MAEPVILVLTTLPDVPSAERMAAALVEKKLAACVNIHGSMTSVYSWKGKLERGEEHQLVIKTTEARYSAVETFIAKQHPYELPEILVLAVQDGLPGYLEWVNSCIEQ